MMKYCHCSKPRVPKGEKLLNHRISNDGGILLVHGISETKLIFDAQVADNFKIPGLRKKLILGWL